MISTIINISLVLDTATIYKIMPVLGRSKMEIYFAVDTGRKLNVHKTFRRRPGRLLNVLCAFNLRPVSTGLLQS